MVHEFMKKSPQNIKHDKQVYSPPKLVIPTYKLAKAPLVIPTSRNVNDEK